MKKLLFTGAGIFLLASCQTYQKLELSPDKILSELEAQRQQPIGAQELTFAKAAKMMDEKNLRLKRIRKRYHGLKTVADIKTPLPNPTLEAGPSFGSRLVETAAGSTQPFVGLGFSVPLGPRLRRNDELNQVRALEGYNEQVLNHRELYFDLRQSYVSFAMAQKIFAVQNDIQSILELTETTTSKLLKMGSINKIGLSSVKIQLAELKLEKLDERINAQSALSELAKLLVLGEDILNESKIKSLPAGKHQYDYDSLKSKLILNNADLARAEMRFHIADAQLRLDLAEQYPDLNIGFSGEQEVGEKKRTFSIPFSIELPIFDRNRQEIAASLSKREEALIDYKEVLNTSITGLKKLFTQYQLTQQKMLLMKETLLPLSKANLEDAKKAVTLGVMDILRYLDLMNAHQKLKLENVKLEQGNWGLLIKLEKICGQPLINTLDGSFPQVKLQIMESQK